MPLVVAIDAISIRVLVKQFQQLARSAKAVVCFEREPFPTSLAKPSLYFQGNSLLKYLLMTENSKKNKRGA